jgi:hypothetical protein
MKNERRKDAGLKNENEKVRSTNYPVVYKIAEDNRSTDLGETDVKSGNIRRSSLQREAGESLIRTLLAKWRAAFKN